MVRDVAAAIGLEDLHAERVELQFAGGAAQHCAGVAAELVEIARQHPRVHAEGEQPGAAALRRVEYRGVVTATMIYDKHAIFDHFRRVNENTVLGVMDRKGETPALYFWLRRRPA